MKILIIQHLFFLNGTGGTEKIACFLANIFFDQGYQVEIMTCENTNGKAMFPLYPEIKVTNIFDPGIEQLDLQPIYNYKGRNPFLWIKHKIKKKIAKRYNNKILEKVGGESMLYRFNLEKRALNWKRHIDSVKPDLIITMSIASLLEITYQNSIGIPIIDSVNGRPDYDFKDMFGSRKPFMVDLLTTAFMHLKGIQVLFESYKDYLPSSFTGKYVVIPNPVPQTEDTMLVNHDTEKPRKRIIHIARLDVDCKQQNILIDIFSRLSDKYQTWDMELWGIGPDYNQLKDQIESLDLADRIYLKGFTKDPIRQLFKSDLFVFPSKYEGFPLALTEAMSIGLPCLGFSSCSGVNELIQHEKTGYLASSLAEFEIYLTLLMDDPKKRAQFGMAAHKAMSKYTPEIVKARWNNFISEVIEGKGHQDQ